MSTPGGPLAAARRRVRGGSAAERQPPAPPPDLDPGLWASLLSSDAEARSTATTSVGRAPDVERYRTALVGVLEEADRPLAHRRAAGESLERIGDPRIHTHEPDMLAVPAGPFRMGTLEADAPRIIEEYAHAHVIPRFLAKEMPQHEVQVDAFEIGRFPVTNREYAEFTEATGHRAPASWPEGKPPEGRGNHPVIRIEHEDAVAYTTWLSGVTGRRYRLPTEAEWEKAARGEDGRVYPWGNYFDPSRCNTLEGNTFAGLYRHARPLYGVVMRVGAFVVDRGLIGDRFDRLADTTPVGIYPDGASPYGALDMAGNAEEWVADRFALYPGYRADEDYDWSAESWVCRGGAWNRPGDVARVARRHGNFVGTGSIGLRLAR
jgi:formylglycine-generating enzyme required for sulfatase activity